MKTFFQSLLLLFIVHLSFIIGHSQFVLAQSVISYPVSILGSCRDAKECTLYCKIPENKAACWSYGKYVLNTNVLGTTTMSTEERTTMETKARQYGVTFPIAELGNCTGPQECRDYCELTANQTACMNFAKKKGFAQEMEQQNDGIPQEKRQAVMQSARTELGCSSMESCRMICEQNQDTCEAFAKKHGISKEPSKEIQEEQLKKTQMLRVAKEELGCTSMESCKTICQQNPTRCMTFAQKNGYDKRTNISQPNPVTRPPCASDESCKLYCKEHPNECPGYQGKPGFTPLSSPSAGFVGPTGCRNEEECKSYCQNNPSSCPGFVQSADYKKNMEKFPRVINESSPSSIKNGGQRPETQSAPSTGNVQYQPIPITPQ